MKRRKVVSAKNLPIKNPISAAIITYLLLEKFQASGWLYGVCGTIYAILFIAFLVDHFTNEDIDIFKDDVPRTYR